MKVKRVLALAGIAVFLFVSLVGLNLSMSFHKDGQMSNCPFMTGQYSICQMPAGNHISQWQQIFAATPPLFNILLLSVIFFVGLSFLISQFALAPPNIFAFRTYSANHPESKLFNNLLLAFSDGILQPKIFS